MPSDPCKADMKFILSDKSFDAAHFVATRFRDFLYHLVNYLKKRAVPKERKFRKASGVKVTKVVMCLEKLQPHCTAEEFCDDMRQNLDIVFCFLFHPNSCGINRPEVIKLYLKLVFLFKDQLIRQFFESSLRLVIPFALFDNNPSEEHMQEIEKYIPKDVRGISDKHAQSVDSSIALATVAQWLEALAQKWKERKELCSDLFFRFVLAWMFPEQAARAGVTGCSRVFRNLPPPAVRTLLTFLKDFEARLQELVMSPENMMLLVYSLEEIVAKYADGGQEAFAILNTLIKADSLMSMLMKVSVDLYMSVPSSFVTSICESQKGKDKEAKMPLVRGFLACLVEFMNVFIKTLSREQVAAQMKNLFTTHKESKYGCAYLFMTFTGTIISGSMSDAALWKCVTDEVVASDEMSAIACRYAQYLALVAFPAAFNIDTAALAESANQLVLRKARIKAASAYDFLIENIDTILNSPDEYLRKFPRVTWPDPKFEQFSELLSELCIPQLADITNILPKCELYLTAFDKYLADRNPEVRARAFAPMCSFCDELFHIREFPPETKYTSSFAMSACLNKLLKGVSQPDYLLRKRGMEVIMSIFKRGELIVHMDVRIMSMLSWAIVVTVLAKEHDAAQVGFEFGWLLVQQGVVGATSFISLLLAVAETGRLAATDSLVGFLASQALFEAETRLPNSVIERVKPMLASEKEWFAPDAAALLEKTGANGKKRALDRLMSLEGDWSILLPGYAIVLTQQLSQTPIDMAILKAVFDKFTKALLAKNVEAVDTIKSLMTYVPTIVKEALDAFIGLVKKMIDLLLVIIVNKENVWFIHSIIILITDLLVNAGKETMSLPMTRNFVKFVAQLPTDEDFADLTHAKAYVLNTMASDYGRYPYPQGVHYSHSQVPFLSGQNDEDELFATKTGALWRVQERAGTFSVMSQIQSGHFKWSFKEIGQQYTSQSQVDQVSFPSFGEDKTTKVVKSQKSFTDKFSQFTQLVADKHMSPHENILACRDAEYQDALPHIEKCNKNMENKQFQNHQPPPVFVPNRVSVVTSCGLADNSVTNRYRFKVGVVFVGDGVREQNEIFSTEFSKTTPHFQEFLTGLGYPIDLLTHIGYDGGLDLKKGVNGKTSIFYCNSNNETMFHVGPLIPTDKGDTQQVYKKRHIGNDHVHIIWDENLKFYHTGTITSQFNQCHIVIHPLSTTGLFRVKVTHKDDLGFFTPCRSSVIVEKKDLPALVRATAISAMMAIYNENDKYQLPQNEIIEHINDIRDKYLDPDDNWYEYLMGPDIPGQKSARESVEIPRSEAPVAQSPLTEPAERTSPPPSPPPKPEEPTTPPPAPDPPVKPKVGALPPRRFNPT